MLNNIINNKYKINLNNNLNVIAFNEMNLNIIEYYEINLNVQKKNINAYRCMLQKPVHVQSEWC